MACMVSAPVLATTSTTTDGGDGQAKAMATGQISMRLVSDAVVPLSQAVLNAVICFQGDSDRVFSNGSFSKLHYHLHF